MHASELKHISNHESEMETENVAVNLIIPANLYDVTLLDTSSSNNCVSTNVNNSISTNSYVHILKNYNGCDSSANIESQNFDPLETSKIELLQKQRKCVKSFQKSKKTFPLRTNNHKLIPKRSARKSASSASTAFSNFGDIGIAYKCSGKSINEKQNKFKKRKMGKTMNPLHEFQIENSDSSSSSSLLSVQNDDDILPVAKKTFKKPFTAARKSVTESRDLVPKLAAKTFPCRQHSAITLTNFVISDGKEDSVTFISLKDASDAESSNLSEMSDEDVRNTRICSPVKELMISHPVCCCSEKEKPCICTDGNLQEVCEGEDTVDDNIIPCSNKVSKQYLLTPSSEIRHRAFCDIHLWRLQRHHCCPKCGVFCTQGSFMLCSSDDTGKTDDQLHLFHQGCFLLPVPGLPPRCPHCCKYSIFKTINLFLTTQSGEQDSKNCELSSDIKNLTSDLEDYNILMKNADSVSQKIVTEKMPFVPESHDLETMIDALANDKSLHLRPKGKCLYNPIKTGDVKKVVHLIANGVNANHKFKMHKNATPLHVAAHHGFTGIIHILCQAGALIDAVNDDLETPLMVAVDKNQISAVRYLVLSGAQTDTKNENGLTALHIAARNGFMEIAQYLYNTGCFDINIQDDGGWTPLVWACENKHDDFIKWLLEMKADPNIRDKEENTALHWAAYSGVVSIVQDLLDNGCNLNYVNLR
ncbi:Histone-lysine N-methyltransferase EHMT1, partial [Stegodyphus mimosarum]